MQTPEEILNILDDAEYVIAFIRPDSPDGSLEAGPAEVKLNKGVIARALRVASAIDTADSLS